MQGRLRCVAVACALLAGGAAVPASALAAPGAPAGLAAPTPSNIKPTLSWAAPADPGTGVTGYNVYRGATRVTATPLAPTARSYVDSGITTQGSQTYTVRALDASGEGPPSNAVTVLYDTTPPGTPSGLTGATPTRTAPVLSWNAATDSSSGVDQYRIYRNNSQVGTSAGLTFTDSSLTVSGSQSYTVRAVDAAGNVSAASAAKPIVFDVLAPTAPSLSAPQATATAPTLTWTAATDAGGSLIVRYDVYRDGAYAGSPTPGTALSFTDTGASTASPQYVVYAVDGAGNRSPASNSRTVTIDTTPPGTPGAASAVSPTNAKPVVAFTPAADVPGGSGVAKYNVYRGSTLAGFTLTTSFTDTGAAGNTTQVYTVRAVDAAGNEGAASPSVTITYDTAPPTAPTGLAGTTPTNTKPVLSWNASSDTLSGVVRYDVYRGTTRAGTTTGLTFTDADLGAEGSQSYTVKAVDAAGNVSAASTTKLIIHDVTPPAVPTLSAAAATNAAPSLSWTAVTDAGGSSLNRYEVYRDGVLVGSPPSATGLTFTDATPLSEGDYVYTVRAVDGAGNRSVPSNARTVVVDVTAPGLPGPIAAATPTNAKPSLSWTAATDPSGSGVTRYEVWRASTLVGTTTLPALVDSGAAANTSPSYTVRAIDAAGNVGPFTAAAVVVYDTLAPPVPTLLTGATPTSAVPALSWTSGGADNLAGLSHYVLLRGTTAVGMTTGLTLSDTAVPATGSHSYTVKAVDLAGNTSGASVTKAIVYDSLTPGAPGKPVIPSPTIHPALTWTAATDVGGSNIVRYDVLRGGMLAGSTSGTTFTDPSNLGDGTYTYTVVAVDGAGNQSVPSASTSAVVDASPPTAPGAPAGPATTSAKPTLSWSPSTDTAGGSGVALYKVYRGPALAGQSTGTTFTDTAVTINGSYTYTVRAVDVAGNEGPPSPGLDVLWDSTPPPAPRDLLAPSPTGAEPTLTWSSGGGASDFDHYDVYRGSIRLGSTAATTWTDTTITTSGNYAYTVKAVDALGNASAASAVRTVVVDASPPSAPPTLLVPTPTRSAILTWTAATDAGGSGLARYEVYRDATLVASTPLLTYTDTAPPDGVYTYTVRAVDGAGTSGAPSPARTVLVDRTAPEAPTGLTAPTPSNTPQLSWSAASDLGTGGSGVVAYRVFRNNVPLGETPTPTYADASTPPDDTYLYSVAALDGAGNEGPRSATVAVLVDGTPPPVPLSLSVAALSTSRPSLTWSSGGPDALSGFSHYEVLRDGAVVGTTSSEAFTDAALPQNGTHVYAVRAVDLAGSASRPSASRSAIWDDTAPEVPVDLVAASPTNRPSLSWRASEDTGGANGVVYRVLRDNVAVATTATPSFVDGDPLADGAVTYRVVAIDAAGNESAESDPGPVTVDTTPPPRVARPDADTPTSRPALSWTAVTDNSGIARYDVYRSGRLVGSSTVALFADGGVAADAGYAYTVVAVDNAGNAGPASPPLDVVWDRTAPRAPGQPLGETPTRDIPVLSWSSGGPDNLAGFSHYSVYRDGLPVGVSTTATFVDAEIVESGVHVYTVRAHDHAGNLSPPSPPRTLIYDTLPPPAPEGFFLPGPTNLPALSWTASNDDATGSSGVVAYRVYRDGALASTTTAPSYLDASLGVSGSHAYWVTAVDAVGNESVATPTQVVYVDLAPPSVPPDLIAQSPAVTPSLRWSPATDQPSGNSGIDHYDVYRDGVLIGRTTGTSYADDHVVVSARVSYTVRAVDGAGNAGPHSNPAVVDVDVTGPELSELSVPRRRTVGETVIFSVRAVDPQGSTVAPPRWTFGDGTARGNTVSHVFGSPGTYQINVAASDALGNVTAGPPATIEIVPRLAKAQLTVMSKIKLKAVRRAGWTVRSAVTVDEPATVTVTLLRGKTALVAVKRKVADGQTGVALKLPAKARKLGTYQLRLTVEGSSLRSQRTVRLVK